MERTSVFSALLHPPVVHSFVRLLVMDCESLSITNASTAPFSR